MVGEAVTRAAKRDIHVALGMIACLVTLLLLLKLYEIIK